MPTVPEGRPTGLTLPEAAAGHAGLLPEMTVLAAAMVLNQRELQDALLDLSPQQNHFLRMRLLCTSDVEARHLAGHRSDLSEAVIASGKARLTCKCSVNLPGWTDLREQSLAEWKRQPLFRSVYDTMLKSPQLYAATRLEQLSATAAGTYERLLTDPNTSDSVKRLAAKDVLTMNGMMAPDGAKDTQNSLQQSMMFQIARARWERGLELSQEQRMLLRQGGVDADNPPPATVRTLDGEDGEQPIQRALAEARVSEVVDGQFTELPAEAGAAAGAADVGGREMGPVGELREEVPPESHPLDDDATEAARAFLESEGIDVAPAEAQEPPELSDRAISAFPAHWR